jgi:asparagine synthase (glutamine-hydrolysing)
MCGIAGAFSFKNSSLQVGSSYLERMTETLAHRGPDGAGTWVSPDRRVGLGHRRLSIIDLSTAASQPMCNEDGSV